MKTPSDLDEARRRIIVALDVDSPGRADELVDRLGGTVSFFKVGLELWNRGGQDVARRIASSGARLFLDLKLHDIPRTVTGAAAAVADLGATFLTVHGPPSSVRAAADAVRGTGLGLLGVTVLTSITEDEQREYGGLAAGTSLGELVLRRADLLLEAGCAGVVASPKEAPELATRIGDAALVTPGIRPVGADAGDQARVATPAAATAAGSDYLVVGRPVLEAPDPAEAAEAIVAEAWRGFQARAG